MESQHFPSVENPSDQPSPPKKQHQIQGPRPSPLNIRQDSHKIKKPPLPPRRNPVVIYAVSPKVIHTEVSEFMAVVQRLTGLSSGDFSHDGNVSPAARLAVTEKASPKDKGLTAPDGGDDIARLVEEVEIGQFQGNFSPIPGILSPAPGMLPPVQSDFFSSLNFPNDLVSPAFDASNFLGSPSTLFSAPLVSPMHSPYIFNFVDF